jgi:polar amino acid transport system permease protein
MRRPPFPGAVMGYVFQFGVVTDHADELIQGALATVWMTAAGAAGGLLLAVVCVFLRTAGSRPVRWIVISYVELIRNTPFLVQLFALYFSLPAIGIRLSANVAAVIGLAISFGGYTTEILRSGIEAVPRGQIEAGRALGLTTFRIFRHIILYPAFKIVYPALASQLVILLLGSSIVSAISATELTAITNSLQSQTFRAFEFYFVAAAMYLAMALAAKGILGSAYWLIFVRGKGR